MSAHEVMQEVKDMSTRIIRVTECAQCPHVSDTAYVGGIWKSFCGLCDERQCPPTGTPDLCPLERLEQGEVG